MLAYATFNVSAVNLNPRALERTKLTVSHDYTLKFTKDVEHVKYAQVWNWGKTDDTERLSPKDGADHFRELKDKPTLLVIDHSLLRSLKTCLFLGRVDVEARNSPLYKLMKEESTRFTTLLLLRLNAISGGILFICRPIAHVIVDIMACVIHLREEVTKSVAPNMSDVARFEDNRKTYWKQRLDTSGDKSSHSRLNNSRRRRKATRY